MAGRRRKYKVTLTNTERNRLKEVVRDKRTSNTIRNRCRILLALDENQTSATTYDECAYYLGVSKQARFLATSSTLAPPSSSCRVSVLRLASR